MKVVSATANTGNTRHDSFKAQQSGGSFDAAIYPLTLYYESACPLCNAEMTKLMLRNTRGLLVFDDVSAPGFSALPEGVSMPDLLDLIHARRADGQVIKGVEVFRLAYEAVGLNWVTSALRLPVLGKLAERFYPTLARNRHRIPRVLTGLMFAGAVRRAAEKAAAQGMRCAPGDSCRL
ncbi:MAG: DUF393 domain-containing protein [Pseudomonadota bacterium]